MIFLNNGLIANEIKSIMPTSLKIYMNPVQKTVELMTINKKAKLSSGIDKIPSKSNSTLPIIIA